ncbi:UDP-N-acetylmuramoyl-tripeptide--D-alanyl-D-alanine ligase [Desulfosarcina sp. BuS5]|uniref:UDP-N-acetylmuramoyl-tripeptide--D-alanyl-D- alanine ligase n=1 Tax=Desulfosarcina sp. BuS5 TaxID=933262 RepID=UPI0004808D73|nr:UDP-N-acetylmuramoyl-tripeptide--D-alanyl-D-alanine ligase [Desulfosarcina sp. BuS5]WDN88097.1 UDP-N-acetylmuramoyl-tripeptide--D-alanyl-D-alanine ligase [Desulfosarcina sp. BuS5]
MIKSVPWHCSRILEAVRGELLYGDAERLFAGISIDSRTLSLGDLFVAIKGQNYDGHDFIADAVESGAAGFLVGRSDIAGDRYKRWARKGLVCLAVENTIEALGDIASLNRKRTGVSVVAITGSNGKTTTKEMTASVLSRRFDTLATKGNYNNEIGLPLTMFRLAASHKWAVLELGMNRLGEIGRLAGICRPDIGVITNIGTAHLEGFDSIEGIARAKGELLEHIRNNGTAVLNADDPRLLGLAGKIQKDLLLFGFHENAGVRAQNIKQEVFGLSFSLLLPGESVFVNLKAHSPVFVSNALAAAAAAHLAGLNAGEIKSGLEDFQPAEGRMNIMKTRRGFHIIDDTYNANPCSMKAAINALKYLKGQGRGIFVAGDMFELGKDAGLIHQEIGALAAISDISRLYITGAFSDDVAKGAQGKGLKSGKILSGTKEAILDDLTNRIKPGDWVLVKGSRAMCMEDIVKGLKKRGNVD